MILKIIIGIVLYCIAMVSLLGFLHVTKEDENEEKWKGNEYGKEDRM